MPRPPRFASPLRLVRKAVGQSQSEFARTVGVSEPYIRAIENGQRKINEDLIEVVSLLFGITPESLRPVEGFPIPIVGHFAPFESTVNSWISSLGKLHRELPDSTDEQLFDLYRQYCVAARQRGHAMLFRFLFLRWMTSTAARLNLPEVRPLGSDETPIGKGTPISWFFDLHKRLAVSLPTEDETQERAKKGKKQTRPSRSDQGAVKKIQRDC